MNSNATSSRTILVESAKNWLVSQGYKLKGPDVIEDSQGVQVGLDTVMKCYRIDMAPLNTRGVTNELRQDAFDLALDSIFKENIAATLASISYEPALVERGSNELAKFLTLITGSEQEIAVPLAVMRHFIWQIKRKMSGKGIKYPLMPVFFGPQGTGKSFNISYLLRPLEAYRLKKSVTEIIDPRNFKTLSENFVCFLDEMGRAEMADVESLKAVISDDVVSYRPLYTNRNSTVPQNTTFIGASNRDIRTLIKDPTGMRRFYQITCTEDAKSDAAWQLLRELDYVAIWRAVNENESEPEILQWTADLAEHQEGIRHQTSIEEFITEHSYAPGTERVLLKDIYQQYDSFCSTANMKPFSRPSFAQELVQLGFVKGRIASGVFILLNKQIKTAGQGKMVEGV
jgi:hypothetical protein